MMMPTMPSLRRRSLDRPGGGEMSGSVPFEGDRGLQVVSAPEIADREPTSSNGEFLRHRLMERAAQEDENRASQPHGRQAGMGDATWASKVVFSLCSLGPKAGSCRKVPGAQMRSAGINPAVQAPESVLDVV